MTGSGVVLNFHSYSVFFESSLSAADFWRFTTMHFRHIYFVKITIICLWLTDISPTLDDI